MKVLVLVCLLAVSFSAKADDGKPETNCEKAAVSVARTMFLGNASAEGRNMAARIADYADDNVALAFQVEIGELLSDRIVVKSYKLVAKGNQQKCEIISATKLSK